MTHSRFHLCARVFSYQTLPHFNMGVPDRAVYATQPRPLRNQIEKLLRASSASGIQGEIVAVVVPDDNLLTGGGIAADVYKVLEGRSYDTVIVVAPSHTGDFGRIHVCSVDDYHTALGNLRVNDQIRNELCDEDDDIFLDNEGHFHTEGVDVQLPFLQTVLKGEFDVVPVVMGNESPDFCRELGQAIGEVMYSRRALVVATADILEGVPEDIHTFRDLLATADVSRLMALLNSGRVRMEGKGPLLVALIAALHRKANQVHILDIQNPEDGRSGYLGVVVTK